MGLKLGEVTSLIIFYNIAISWLQPPNDFQFNFLLCDSASQEFHSYHIDKFALLLLLRTQHYLPNFGSTPHTVLKIKLVPVISPYFQHCSRWSGGTATATRFQKDSSAFIESVVKRVSRTFVHNCRSYSYLQFATAWKRQKLESRKSQTWQLFWVLS